MDSKNKPLVWLHGEIKTPPLSKPARIEAGYLLRRLQMGESPSMPWSRPMPSIGPRCHELRITDEKSEWRVIYQIDKDALIILELFQKKTRQTPQQVVETCKRRLRQYDQV